MKKLLIVNNNMKIGGVQKSLCNLLWSIHDNYEISLLLFNKSGEYLNELPDDVKIVNCDSWFKYLGMSQAECSGSKKNRIIRGSLAAISKIFGRNAAVFLVKLSQKTLQTEYDCAISYLQNGNPHNFYGGVNDFVIYKTKAKKKIAFIHCDYSACGSNTPVNNRLYYKFDRIAACSDGCRNSFLKALPELSDACFTVPNFYRFDEIKKLSQINTKIYLNDRLNLLIVARLAHEKGVERALKAVSKLPENSVYLHIVGSGAKEAELQQLTEELQLEKSVIFYGEQSNPYRFMPNADLLLLTSYHEAAPMVIDEALSLGLPVLSTETSSSREMIEECGIGVVCDNSQEGINNALLKIVSDRATLAEYKERAEHFECKNEETALQFASVLE